MALKPDRNIVDDTVSYFIPAITYGGDRGGVVVATGATPSGAAMDQTVNGAWYAASGTSEAPIGLLLNDVVNIDLTRQVLNPYKSEAQVGDKGSIMRKGWAVTDMVDTTTGSVTVGASAYVGPSGKLTADSGQSFPQAGKFLSGADEDGYYKIYIDL
jgi:hypothetical protein